MNDVNDVYDVARIHDDYIVNHRFAKSGRYLGWIKGTIRELRVPDDSDNNLIMEIEFPWSEVHVYGWDDDDIVTGALSDICDAYGYSVSEFERLEGNEIWLKVEEVGSDDNGDVYTASRMDYDYLASGPHAWKHDVVLLTIVALVLLLVPIALMVLL